MTDAQCWCVWWNEVSVCGTCLRQRLHCMLRTRVNSKLQFCGLTLWDAESFGTVCDLNHFGGDCGVDFFCRESSPHVATESSPWRGRGFGSDFCLAGVWRVLISFLCGCQQLSFAKMPAWPTHAGTSKMGRQMAACPSRSLKCHGREHTREPVKWIAKWLPAPLIR